MSPDELKIELLSRLPAHHARCPVTARCVVFRDDGTPLGTTHRPVPWMTLAEAAKQGAIITHAKQTGDLLAQIRARFELVLQHDLTAAQFTDLLAA